MPGFPPKYEECVGMGGGLLTVAISNYFRGFPINTRYPVYAVAMTAGYFGGMALIHYQDKMLRKKLIYINDYVQRHPKDYEVYLQDRKFKDILDPWNPKRNN